MKALFQLVVILGITLLCSCNQSPTASTATATLAGDSIGNRVIKTIMERRSIRKYKPQPIEPEKIQEILKCGVYAPNGKGKESWEVRVVNTPKLISEIDSLYLGYIGGVDGVSPHHATYGASMIVFIAYDTTYDLSQVDCGMIGANMLLSAQSMGIGSCCLGGIARFMNEPQSAELLKRLQLPQTHKLLYAIAFGYADESPTPKKRNMDKVKFID